MIAPFRCMKALRVDAQGAVVRRQLACKQALASNRIEDDEKNKEYISLHELVFLGKISDAEYNAALEYAVRAAAKGERLDLYEALEIVLKPLVSSRPETAKGKRQRSLV